MPKNLAVVIPFYQREKGILPAALERVFAQDLPDDVRVSIFIVDDGSPIKLSDELSSVCVPDRFRLVALSQENGGPGAARNKALEALSSEPMDFVAFLDSDDAWRPEHLAQGLSALGDDADFYFCDHERWHNERSWFEESEHISPWLQGAGNMVSRLPGHSDIFEFRAGRGLLGFLQDYMAQTSTVIYRWSRFPALRFDPTLRHAGEDNMFWLELANGARAVRFSTRANVRTGEGVNMYFSSITSWDHEDSLRRIGYNLLFLAKAINRFGRISRAREFIDKRYWHCQKEFAWVLVRRLLKNQSLEFPTIRSLISERKSMVLTLPLAFCAAALRRPNGSGSAHPKDQAV